MFTNPKIDDAYIRIWKGYKFFAQGALVPRIGYELVGTASTTDPDESITDRFRLRGESIMEHSAKVAYLCSAFMSHFPGIFEDAPPFDDGLREHDAWLVSTISLLHDVGEVAVGDIPDDGNPMHDIKDELERNTFDCCMAPAYPREEYLPLRVAYADFQEHRGFGQVIFALDKLEAILCLVWLEQYEIYGSVYDKPTTTAQDIHYASLTGTPCATDCWAAHSKDRLRDLPPKLTHHIFELLRVAVLDVRGEWFDWWDKI